jgi:hypothetical protein
MTRYYFNFVGTADDDATDEEGTEFPDDVAAMQHAVRVARNLTVEMISEGERIDAQRIDVVAGTRRVGTLPLLEAIRMAPPNRA